MLRLIRNLVIILALIVGVAFGYFNYGSTPVDLLWTKTHAPLAILLGSAFLLGLLVALLVCGARLIRLRARLASVRRQLRHAEKRLGELDGARSVAEHEQPAHDA